jgi:hypothetical protein
MIFLPPGRILDTLRGARRYGSRRTSGGLRIAEVEAKGPPFGLLTIGQDWNCESFARYISAGTPVSNQANVAKKVGLAVFVTGTMMALAVDVDHH